MNAPGTKLLKITGVLLLIGGIFASAISCIMIYGVIADMLGLTIGGVQLELQATGASLFMTVVGLIACLSQAVTGAWGTKNSQNTQKARQGIIMGIITIVLNAVFVITNALGFIFGSGGIIVTAIFLVGAFKNKAAA